MVFGEITLGQVTRLAGLIIQAVVGLRGVTEVRALMITEFVVQAGVVPILEKRPGNDGGRLRGQPGGLGDLQLRKRGGIL